MKSQEERSWETVEKKNICVPDRASRLTCVIEQRLHKFDRHLLSREISGEQGPTVDVHGVLASRR